MLLKSSTFSGSLITIGQVCIHLCSDGLNLSSLNHHLHRYDNCVLYELLDLPNDYHLNISMTFLTVKALSHYTQNCKDFFKKIVAVVKKVVVCMEEDCIFLRFHV